MTINQPSQVQHIVPESRPTRVAISDAIARVLYTVLELQGAVKAGTGIRFAVLSLAQRRIVQVLPEI